MILDGKTIFVVEDDALSLAIVSSLLRHHGAIVYFDRWGVNTTTQMAALPQLDLIVLDLMLPHGMSGFTIFEEIRRLPELAKIPVVIVSAADADEAIPRAQGLGINGFIAKPIDYKTFPEHINSIMNGNPVWIHDSTAFSD